MNREKVKKIFFILSHLMYMMVLIFMIFIWIFSIGVSKWGQPRYEANFLSSANILVDRKNNVRLLSNIDNAFVDEQYIYGIYTYAIPEHMESCFIKIDYINDFLYLYQATDTQIEYLTDIYKNRIIILSTLDSADQQIYLQLKLGKGGSLVKSPKNVGLWGKCMWDEFRF